MTVRLADLWLWSCIIELKLVPCARLGAAWSLLPMLVSRLRFSVDSLSVSKHCVARNDSEATNHNVVPVLDADAGELALLLLRCG